MTMGFPFRLTGLAADAAAALVAGGAPSTCTQAPVDGAKLTVVLIGAPFVKCM